MAEPASLFDNGTALLLIGALQLALPTGSAVTLLRHRNRAIDFWLLGSLCGAAGAVMVGMRQTTVSTFWSFNVGSALIIWYALLRIRVMLEHLGRPPKYALTFPAMSLNYVLWYHLARAFVAPVPRIVLATVCSACVFGWCAWLAFRLARQHRSASSLVIGLAQTVLAVSQLARTATAVRTNAVLYAEPTDRTMGLIAAVGVVVAVVENFAYLGLVVEEQQRALVRDAADAVRRDEARTLGVRLAQAERQRTLDLLAGSVSAGLEGPLNAIRISATRARGALRSSSTAHGLPDLMAAVETQVRTARASLTRLRDLARPSEPHLESLDVGLIVSDVCELLEFEARTTGVQLTVEADGTSASGRVFADRMQLLQVVLNVVRNALAAASGSEHATVAVAVHREADRVAVMVTDSGPGLPPGLEERVRSPLGDVAEQGSGLGLAVAIMLLDSMRGTLHFDSGDRRGTCVAIHLPLHAEQR